MTLDCKVFLFWRTKVRTRKLKTTDWPIRIILPTVLARQASYTDILWLVTSRTFFIFLRDAFFPTNFVGRNAWRKEIKNIYVRGYRSTPLWHRYVRLLIYLDTFVRATSDSKNSRISLALCPVFLNLAWVSAIFGQVGGGWGGGEGGGRETTENEEYERLFLMSSFPFFLKSPSPPPPSP